jgi:hypothetical protein
MNKPLSGQDIAHDHGPFHSNRRKKKASFDFEIEIGPYDYAYLQPHEHVSDPHLSLA